MHFIYYINRSIATKVDSTYLGYWPTAHSVYVLWRELGSNSWRLGHRADAFPLHHTCRQFVPFDRIIWWHHIFFRLTLFVCSWGLTIGTFTNYMYYRVSRGNVRAELPTRVWMWERIHVWHHNRFVHMWTRVDRIYMWTSVSWGFIWGQLLQHMWMSTRWQVRSHDRALYLCRRISWRTLWKMYVIHVDIEISRSQLTEISVYLLQVYHGRGL